MNELTQSTLSQLTRIKNLLIEAEHLGCNSDVHTITLEYLDGALMEIVPIIERARKLNSREKLKKSFVIIDGRRG